MPVANVRSKWSAGDLVFYESVAGNGASVQFGEDASGMDMQFFGATADSYMLWDESIDTLALANAGITITGASGYALDIQTTGQFRMGIQGTGIPTATATPYAMEIHAETNADAIIEAGDTGFTAGLRCRYEISKAQTAMVGFQAIEGRLRVKAALADGVHCGVSGSIEADAAMGFTGTATTQRSAGNFCVELGSTCVFRFVYRVDGQPKWAEPLTPFKGDNTLSPFVALAVRE